MGLTFNSSQGIGGRVRKLIREYGYSIEDIALHLDMTPANFRKLFNDNISWKESHIRKLASLFDVPFDHIAFGKMRIKMNNKDLSERIRIDLEYIGELDRSERNKVMALLLESIADIMRK